MAALTTDYLNNATREHFIPGMRNNLYEKIPLLNRFLAAGRVKEASGRSLIRDVVSKKHAAFGLYDPYDVFPSQQANPVAQISLNWAYYEAVVAISGPEERQNQGSKERLIDMVDTSFKNAMATFKDGMATDLYGDGSTIGGKRPITGLGAIVGTSNTYANIARSTTGNDYWQSNVTSSSYTFVDLIDPTSSNYLPKLMQSSCLNATHDEGPDLIVTTKAVYAMYCNIARANNLRIDNSSANLGFESARFEPFGTVIFDTYCTTGYMYFLTLADFEFYIFSGANFDMKEPGWQIPPRQDVKSCDILWNGQLLCNVPRQQALLKTIATS
jgi:hypothetical protein